MHGIRLCPSSPPRCLTTALAGGRHATHCLFSSLSSFLWLDWWFFPASKYLWCQLVGNILRRTLYGFFQQLSCLQNHSHHFGALHGVVWALCGLLLLQHPADGATGSSCLLGRLDLAHGLQVPGRKGKTAHKVFQNIELVSQITVTCVSLSKCPILLQIIQKCFTQAILRKFFDKNGFCFANFIFFQLEKDERSEDESVDEEDEVEKAGSQHLDDGEGEHCWEKSSRDSLNSTLSKLTSSCVLNNLTNHRASAAIRIRKAQ